MDTYAWTAFGVGTLLVTVGSGVAGLYAFENRFVVVTFGFFLFFVGYRIAQFAIHTVDGNGLAGIHSGLDELNAIDVHRLGYLSVGLVGIAYGVTMFTQTILHPDINTAVLSGISSIGGYMIAHIGMNETVI